MGSTENDDVTATGPEGNAWPGSDMLEAAWGIIANAGEGDWDREHPEWKAAAERWREQYHLHLRAKPGASVDSAEVHAVVIYDQARVPSLATRNGEIIVGTRRELRAAFGALVITTALLPDDTRPVLNVDEMLPPALLSRMTQRADEHVIRDPWPAAPLLDGFESELVEHARRELVLLGENDEWFVESIVAAIKGFHGCGHSGGSGPIAIDYLARLLSHEALSPLTSDPAEWVDRSEISSHPLWQNARDSRAMSEDGGKTYWMVDEVPEGQFSDAAPRHVSAEQHAEVGA